MKMYNVVFIILILMLIIPDIFFYFKLRNNKSKPVFIVLHLLGVVFFSSIFVYIKFGMESSNNFRIIVWVMWFYFLFLLIYIPKIIHITFYFLNYLFKKKFKRDTYYFDKIRIVITVFVVVIMLVGAFVTPNNFDVIKVELHVKHLPTSFDGYRIIQLSDIHLGSWGREYGKMKKIVRLVNKQHPDLIVFTGDMVNNYADEMLGWKPSFSGLDKKIPKYAITGNHDYGDYTDWKSENDRKQNILKIKQSIADFGFRLLLNEHVYLKKGNDSLMMVGVENWGKSGKSRYCNLNKAISGSKRGELKILLSHDPNHWAEEVIGREDIFLTLSGHTHAAQLGIKIGNRLFSPAAFVFKYWAGLYQHVNQYLYVNKGLGYIGLPMQIGVRPEITLIVLKCK